jgi:serine/threonine protein kinase
MVATMKLEGPPFEGDDYIPPDIEDFAGRSFYTLLKRIPSEHLQKHLIRIENNEYSDDEAVDYIVSILERRTEALTETVISDATILEKIKDRKEDIFRELETDVFSSQENFLGSGMTAKVKYYEINDLDTGEVLPIAVKYLVTPTKMTLSASSEHDMLLEVERIQRIEKIEEEAHLEYIKVPHPYFHHQNENIQCYGMELIDGFDLSKPLSDMPNSEAKDALVQALANIPDTVIEQEIETFFQKMHTYCLHGDIKPANLMVDSKGKFYVIDFGQSRLVTEIPDKAQEQLYVLRDDEIKISTLAIKGIINEARRILAEQ